MKKMMTNMKTLVALLMAGAAVTSCSSDNEMDSPKAPAGKTYTMTVQATKGGDATTRALADGGDGTLTATWATTENVYVKKEATWATGSLKPQTAAATATLKGELSGVNIAANDVLTLQFPKSGDITYAGQKGTLADIAENFDWAIAENVTVTSVDGGNITTDDVTFQHQQAIVRFTLVDKADGTTELSPTALTINDGTSDIVTLTSIPAETYTTNGAGVLYVALPAVSNKPITLTATVGSDTYTLTTSSAKSFANGSFYRVTAKMAEEPEVAGSYFTANSSGLKVAFSQGNLQATTTDGGTNWTWAFAEHQWDYIGNVAANNAITGNQTVSANGTVEFFCWSTASTHYGIHNSMDGNTYSGDFEDWGTLSISNGGGYTWRTLTSAEWKHIFNDRTSGATVNGTTDARYAHATINTDGTAVNGMILFPDGCKIKAGSATWGTINGNSAWGTKCTKAQWTHLEELGCVFLPAAGTRHGSEVSNVGTMGVYWSATPTSGTYAYLVYFYSDGLDSTLDYWRDHGRSVRLVREVAAPAPANKLLSDATAEDIGKVVGADGKIYANVAAAQAASTTACAIIAYVGSETGESQNHGLAIAMKDAAAASYLQWKTSYGSNDNPKQYTDAASAIAAKESGSTLSAGRNSDTWPAFKAALANSITVDLANGISAAAPASGTSGWFLPSLYQWNMIVKGLSGQSADLSISSNDDYKASSLNTKITAAGGDGLWSEGGYLSSTEYDGSRAWGFDAYIGGVGKDIKDNGHYVRSVLAF